MNNEATELVEETKTSGGFDESQYNDYLTSTAGPKKRIDYSKTANADIDMEDLSSFEINNYPNALTEE